MKKQTTKRVYVKPENTVIPMEYTNGLCDTSVQLNKLTEEDWKSVEQKDGDEFEIDVEP
jgi:hypothetical protein